MRKILLILIISIFLISPIIAQEELVHICGGDESLIILCNNGDEQLGYFHNFLDKLVGLGMNVSGRFVGEEGNYTLLIICLLVLLLIIISVIIYKRRKKKKKSI